MVTGFTFLSRLTQIAPPHTRFVFLGAGIRLGLPSHPASRRRSCLRLGVSTTSSSRDFTPNRSPMPGVLKRGACGAAGPASAPGLRPWEARPGARRAAPADPTDPPGSSVTQIGAARSRLPGARLSRARSSGPSRPAGIAWRWPSPVWPGTGSQGTGAYRGVRSDVNLSCPQTQGHPLGGDAGNLIVRHAGGVRALQGGRQDGTIRAGCRGTAAGHRCGGQQHPGAAAGGLGS